MNKTIATLFITAAFAAGSAFAADTTYESKTKVKASNDGSYSKDSSAERSDNSGTVSSEVKTNVDVGSNGNTDKTVSTEHVNDPKGLMNKNKVKTKEEVKADASGQVTSHTYKKTVNGNTVTDSSATE